MSPILSARGGLSAGAYGWGALSAAGTAFESIATATGTGSSGTITFSSIPSTFKHLQIRGIGRTTDSISERDVILRFNSDSGNNYTYHALEVSGTSVSSFGAGANSQTYMGVAPGANRSANIMGAYIIDILDYASTSKYKTLRGFTGYDANGAGNVDIASSMWMSTSAITSITVNTGLNSWNTQTIFALYGIKEA